MLQSLRRFGLAVLFVPAIAVSSEAAIIIAEGPGGGAGTLVHDGQGDVGSVNGSGKGNAPLLGSFVTDASLAADLLGFRILPTFTDGDNEAVSANLSLLYLIGTIVGNPATCPSGVTCGLLSQTTGDTLGFDFDANFDPINDTQNVLFLIPIIGTAAAHPWVDPSSPQYGSPQNILIPSGTASFALTTDQIDFITARMAGLNVNQIRLGLNVIAGGVTETGTTDIGSTWDFTGPRCCCSRTRNGAAARQRHCRRLL